MFNVEGQQKFHAKSNGPMVDMARHASLPDSVRLAEGQTTPVVESMTPVPIRCLAHHPASAAKRLVADGFTTVNRIAAGLRVKPPLTIKSLLGVEIWRQMHFE